MSDPRETREQDAADIESAMDMAERPGQCAYLGGYVQDGETVCHFGQEYICQAPRLVPTGNSC